MEEIADEASAECLGTTVQNMSRGGVDDHEAEVYTDASTERGEAKPGGIQVPFPFSLLINSLECRVVLGGGDEIFVEANVANNIECVEKVDHDLTC